MADQGSKQPNKGYNPSTYWSTREHPNTAEDPGISEHEKKYILSHLSGAQSVLEIGPGVGRLFPLYSKVARVATVDLTMNYRDRATAAAQRAGILVEDHYLAHPLAALPFKERTFDVGVTSHVLMHVPFENIERTMSEAARCCRKVVVLSAMHRLWPRKGSTFDPNWHCFAHDYKAICEDIGCYYQNYTSFVQRADDGAFGFVFGLN